MISNDVGQDAAMSKNGSCEASMRYSVPGEMFTGPTPAFSTKKITSKAPVQSQADAALALDVETFMEEAPTSALTR